MSRISVAIIYWNSTQPPPWGGRSLLKVVPFKDIKPSNSTGNGPVYESEEHLFAFQDNLYPVIVVEIADETTLEAETIRVFMSDTELARLERRAGRMVASVNDKKAAALESVAVTPRNDQSPAPRGTKAPENGASPDSTLGTPVEPAVNRSRQNDDVPLKMPIEKVANSAGGMISSKIRVGSVLRGRGRGRRGRGRGPGRPPGKSAKPAEKADNGDVNSGQNGKDSVETITPRRGRPPKTPVTTPSLGRCEQLGPYKDQARVNLARELSHDTNDSTERQLVGSPEVRPKVRPRSRASVIRFELASPRKILPAKSSPLTVSRSLAPYKKPTVSSEIPSNEEPPTPSTSAVAITAPRCSRAKARVFPKAISRPVRDVRKRQNSRSQSPEYPTSASSTAERTGRRPGKSSKKSRAESLTLQEMRPVADDHKYVGRAGQIKTHCVTPDYLKTSFITSGVKAGKTANVEFINHFQVCPEASLKMDAVELFYRRFLEQRRLAQPSSHRKAKCGLRNMMGHAYPIRTRGVAKAALSVREMDEFGPWPLPGLRLKKDGGGVGESAFLTLTGLTLADLYGTFPSNAGREIEKLDGKAGPAAAAKGRDWMTESEPALVVSALKGGEVSEVKHDVEDVITVA